MKWRIIHDNFLYVKNLATRFNKAKIWALLFKHDIRKVFDSISWEYILDLLQRRCFPHRFQIGLSCCSLPHPRGSSSMVLPVSLLFMDGSLGKATPDTSQTYL
jgi:hypothetical protein